MDILQLLEKKSIIDAETTLRVQTKARSSREKPEQVLLSEKLVDEDFLFDLKSELLKMPVRKVEVQEIGNTFDVIHNHTYPEFINLLVVDKLRVPVITTIHTQMTPELDETLSQFNSLKNCYFVSISQAQRRLAKKTNIWRVIHNGVDTKLYGFSPNKEDYLLWIGRLSKAKDATGNFTDPKGVRWAIRLARETGSKLLLAGNVEDPKFFDRDIKPHLSKKVRWIGPISSEQPLAKKEVAELMQKAKVFLMTVNWYEPFGLVMAESMSCGTPVIGFDRGAVSELVVHGKTGFVVKPKNGIRGLKKALENIDRINPKDCRLHVKENFSLEKMVSNYEKAYSETTSSFKNAYKKH